MKRVLRLLTRPNLGGPTRQAVCLWHAHKRMGLRTLLAVGTCEGNEPSLDLTTAGVPELPLSEALKEGSDAEGFVVIPRLCRRPRPLADLLALRALRSLLRSFRPDVLHTHTTKAGYLGRRAALGEGVPLVVHTFHGHVLRGYFGRPVRWLLRSVEKRMASRSDLLFAVSPSCVRELGELGVAPAERIRVMPPAVETAAFAASDRGAARALLGVPDGSWLVAYVGRLVPIKRVDLFLDAINAVPDITGHVYGGGPLFRSLDVGAGPNGRLMGPADDLPHRLAAYDALVLSSEREGCPLAAIEAFAAGVPVVGFDVPGVCDLLGPWGGGVLVPRPAGARGLAEALRRLRGDRKLSARCVAASRAGLRRFHPDTVARDLAEAYERAISLKSAGARDPSPPPTS